MTKSFSLKIHLFKTNSNLFVNNLVLYNDLKYKANNLHIIIIIIIIISPLQVLSCPDFLSIEFDLLLSFLKQSDLVIPDEFILYQGVVQWWLSNYDQSIADDAGSISPSDSKCFPDIETNLEADLHALDFIQAHELFSSIRFPLMTHTQLNAITSDVERLQQSDSGNFHAHNLMSATSSSSSPQSSPDRKLKVLLAVVEEYAKKALMLQDVVKSAIHLRGDCATSRC